MKISNIKRFYVENTLSNEKDKIFYSLKKAVEYVIEQANENLLIHIGGYNLEYYIKGDTVNSLYLRCSNIIATLKA